MRYKNTDYDIYEDGRCFSHKTNKFLKPQMTVKYPTYNLTIDGVKRKTKVHRMVAETFIPNEDKEKTQVNHIDGNTHNFNVSNLEWVTPSENSQHAADMSLRPKGSQVPVLLKESFPDEVWVNCIDYPNYEISSYGRVVNKRTKRLLKQSVSNNGYYYVSLWKNNKGKATEIHRIEYQSFFPNENLEGFVINHIDGNRLNNNINNLEKVTYQENNLHAEYISKKHNQAKPVVLVDENGTIIKEYPSIAKATRDGYAAISRNIKYHYKVNNKYYWQYKQQ